MTEDDAYELPIDGILDLHTFHPRDTKSLVTEYIVACRQKGILDVRIIHGKGTGALRETVHSVLKKLPDVESFSLATDRSSWGATRVRVRPPDDPPDRA